MPRRTPSGRLVAGNSRSRLITGAGARLGLGLFGAAKGMGAAPDPVDPPVNVTPPAVTSSTPFIEEQATLTTTSGIWTNDPVSFNYQWRRDGTPISGATNGNYVMVVDDRGADIDCLVTAVNVGGSTDEASNLVGPVLNRRARPEDIAGCVAWYNVDDPAGYIEAGGFLSQVTDLSGAGKHLLQANGAQQPKRTTNAINGHAAIEFEGGQYMAVPNYTALTANLGYTAGAVSVLNSSAASGARLFGWSNNNADTTAGALRINRNGTNYQVQLFAGTAGGSTPIVFSHAQNEPHLVTIQRTSNTNLRGSRDGAAIQTGTPENASLGYVRHSLGTSLASSGAFGVNYWGGFVGPIAFYNAYLDDTTIQILEGILAWLVDFQANLDGAHPYLSSPPRV